MKYTVFDIETDGLLQDVTKVHCLSASTYENGVEIQKVSLTEINEMVEFLKTQDLLVGHNIALYDLPVIKKLTGYEHTGKIFDTLPISWYLYPTNKEHGLEFWGQVLGVRKPLIDDWEKLSLAVYIDRCDTDVLINSKLFEHMLKKLVSIYGNTVSPIMTYLTWKMKCMAEQEEFPLTIDRQHCEYWLDRVKEALNEKIEVLKTHMPSVETYTKKSKPSKMYNIKGDLTKSGEKWLELLADNDLELDFDGEISILKSSTPPKPTSTVQLKAWLFSLGWEPTIFDYKKNTAGQIKAIPQLQDKNTKELCSSIKRLAEIHEGVSALKGLFMLQHRKGVFEGFLECSDEKGKMVASIAGLTNTLRFKHKKPIANLPAVSKPYGKEIRGAIITPDDDHLFCGSDMSSLEDTTKQHYIYFYDPNYVEEMRVPGFDPHLDIAVQAGMLTEEQVQAHKKGEQDHSNVRKDAKQVNFSAVYGVGASKLSITTGWSTEKSQQMLDTYWKRNKAVKQIAADSVVKVFHLNGEVNDYVVGSITSKNRTHTDAFMASVKEMWLYNPVSNFWYSLRYLKDAFSTLNQGTGVYCFDMQVNFVRSSGLKLSLQYHDELGFMLRKSDKEEVTKKLNEAIKQTNQKLKLNVPLGISMDFGTNYAECH